MRSRISFAWALAASAPLVFLLVFSCQLSFAANAPAAGMSAPTAPVRVIESAPAVHLLQSPFDGQGLALRSQNVSLELIALFAIQSSVASSQAIYHLYGPLHRRPPPSIS
jgi:hypothetical protein